MLVLGIAALVVVSKGFPQVRAFLKLFLHPVGLLMLGLLGFWIYWLRTRPTRDGARIIDNSPKRIPPPKTSQEDQHT